MMIAMPQLPVTPCTQLSSHEQRLREETQLAVVGHALQFGLRGLELRLQLRAHEQGLR